MSKITKEHLDELEMGRGIMPKTATFFDLRSVGNRIALPFISRGEVQYCKLRPVIKGQSTMSVEPTGKRPILFNMPAIEADQEKSRLYITEGEFDCMAVAQALPGETVVSVPNGANGFDFLFRDKKLDPLIDAYKEFVLCPDNDQKGIEYMEEMAVRLGRHRCRMARMPEGFKDANEVLTKHDDRDRALAQFVRAADWVIPRRIAPIVDLQGRELGDGLNSGFRAAGSRMMMAFPSLITITGTPGSGKSQFTVNWCLNLARLYGVKSAMIKFEDELEDWKEDVCDYARGFAGNNWENWVRDHIYGIPLYRPEDDDEYHFAWLAEVIYEAACIHNCKIVVIDPWNQMEHAIPNGMTETDYTLKALAQLAKLTNKYQIAIIVVNHPTKSADNKALEDMSMYDVAGSAHWANRSDMVLILARESEESNVVGVKIAKSRKQSRRGKTGIFRVNWDENAKVYVSEWVK